MKNTRGEVLLLAPLLKMKNTRGEVLLLATLLKMKNIPGEVLVLAPLLKITFLHGIFSRFLNSANGTKSRKVSQIEHLLQT